ncbi:hypothetical protein RYA05_13585 [Pseudomonas syringae pv. actinidiae]|nr:hypothetical protein [Pseudomonas syringae pv. actinidiae]
MITSNRSVEAMLGEIKDLKGDSLRLPLPRRLALKPVTAFFKMAYGESWNAIMSESKKEVSAFEVLEKIYQTPELSERIKMMGDSPATLHSMLISLRHLAVNAPIMTVSEALYDLVADTKIKDDVPAKFFCAPFKTTYIEFNDASHRENARLDLVAAGIPSKCEGCYIHEKYFSILPPVSQEAVEILQLDRSKPVRVVEIGFSASPFQNSSLNEETDMAIAFNALDFCVIYIQDEDEPFKEIFERHFEFFRFCNPNFRTLTSEQVTTFEAYTSRNFSLLTKILFYMHVEKRERKEIREMSDLENKLESVADKKKDKIKKQINRSYDRIVIGPQSYMPIMERLESIGSKGSIAVHFRRGYFGIRWTGAGQAKIASLVRVKEAIVNGEMAKQPRERKNYVIR